MNDIHGALVKTTLLAAAHARSAGAPPIVLLGQNAPPSIPPDAPAFLLNTDTGRRALRVWEIDRSRFSVLIRVNALPRAPDELQAPEEAGLMRLHAVWQALGSGPIVIVAAGVWAANVAARHLGLRCRPVWNRPTVATGGKLLAVAHPSGRSLAYNCAAFRAETATAISRFLEQCGLAG